MSGYSGVTGPVGGSFRAQEFLVSGTWTSPAGVTEVWVTACAGGGGGGGNSTSVTTSCSGGGGGGDSVYRKKLTVTASTAYTITIGAGGAAGVVSATSSSVTAGETGGTTSFGALLSLSGGVGGARTVSDVPGNGGSPGGPGGTVGMTGGYRVATYDPYPRIAYGGTSFPGGYGAGGRGSYWRGTGAGSTARAGNQGYMLIEWNE